MNAMDDPIWGSSGHPPLPAPMASPSEMFWRQFWEMVTTYGVAFIFTAFVGGLMFGLALHVIQNILPMKKAKKMEEAKKKREEDLLKEETDEFAAIKTGDSVFRGKMNSKMISALRRSVIYPDKTNRGLGGAMADIEKERQALLAEEQDESEDESSEEEREDHVLELSDQTPLLEHGAEDKSPDLSPTTEEPEGEEGDMLKKLGTLHGKLATAQLRARTRRMQMEMTDAERESEADMRAQQLESIMKLMMQNKEKFGMSTDDVKEQLNLYNF